MTGSAPPTPAHEDRKQHPWLGLMSYGEQDHSYFFGRDREVDELFRQVQREALTVVFGASGTGKTSLLSAGLFPMLRDNHTLPVRIRIDYGDGAAPPAVQVRRHIARAIADHDMEEERVAEAHLPENEETLWEYMHRIEIWDRRNQPVTPALVFDQFEEIFTLGRDRSEARQLLVELADLVENRVPEKVRAHLDATGGRLALPADQQHYKIVLAMREDFVPRLDDLKKQLPSVMRNRFKLSRMNGAQAMTAVTGPGRGIVDEAVAQRIVRFVAAANIDVEQQTDEASTDLTRLEVEPALLSVVCRELNQRRIDAGEPTITVAQVEASQSGILTDFYERSYAGLGDHVRIFVEDNLLTSGGYRRAVPQEDATNAGLTEADVAHLVDRRLLRVEEHLQQPHLELSHDLLTGVVQESRDARHEREQFAQQIAQERAHRRKLIRVAMAILIPAMIVVPIMAVLTVMSMRANKQAQKNLHDAQVAEAQAVESEQQALAAESQARRNEARAMYMAATVEAKNRSYGRALAYLARAVESDQNHRAANHLLLWLVSTRNWLLPAIEPIRHNADGQTPLHSNLFSPRSGDSRFVTAAGNTVEVWSSQTGEPIEGVGPFVLPAQVTATTTRLPKKGDMPMLCGAADERGNVRVWNLDTGETLLELATADQTEATDAARIISMAISPSGNQAAAGSVGGDAIVIDITEQRVLRHLAHAPLVGEDVDPAVRVVAFRPRDSKPELMTVAGYEYRIWNWESGVPVLSGQAKHDGMVMDARYSLTDVSNFDDQIFTFDDKGNGFSWNLVTPIATADDSATGAGNPIAPDAQTHPSALPSDEGLEPNTLPAGVATDNVRPDDADNAKTAYLQFYSVTVAPLTRTGSARVTSLAVGPTDEDLVVGFSDGSIGLWGIGGLYEKAKPAGEAEPVESYRSSPSIPPHNGEVTASAWDVNGMRLATGSSDGDVKIYGLIDVDPETIQCDGAIIGVAFSPDGKQLLIASDDGSTHVWHILPSQATTEPMFHEQPAQAVALSPDGNKLATCDGIAMRVWDRHTHALLWEKKSAFAHVAFLGDAYLVAATNNDDGSAVEVWPIAGADAFAGRLLIGNAPITQLHAADDTPRFVTVSKGRVRVFDFDASAGEVVEFEADIVRDARLDHAQLSPDGRWLMVFSSEKAQLAQLMFLDGGSNAPVYELPLAGALLDAAFSPDSTRLATAGKDRAAHLWQLDQQGGAPGDNPIRLPHRDWVYDLSFNDDGSRLATASRDATAAVWHTLDGTQITVIDHEAAVKHVQLSGDGATLMTQDSERNYRLFDADSGLPQTTDLILDGDLYDASADHNRSGLILEVGSTVQIWDVPAWDEQATGDWLRDLAVVAGGYEVNDQGLAEPLNNRYARLLALRQQVDALEGDSDPVRTARWFLADRRTRTISPFSPVTVSQYVENRLAEAKHSARPSPTLASNLDLLRIALYRCLMLTPDNSEIIHDAINAVEQRTNR